MELSTCIMTRTSKRDFKDAPIPREVLDKLFSIALNAPSWANSQPWEVVVSTGETSKLIKERIHKLASEDNPGNPDFPFPETWPEKQSKNIFETGKDRYGKLGILREDEVKRREAMLYNYSFFGSQTAIFICLDKNLGTWSVLDCGMIIQNILLCAHDMGLGACPQAYLVRYPDVLREAFKLPEDKKFLLGISIGYANEENPINKIKTSRQNIQEIVKYYD